MASSMLVVQMELVEYIYGYNTFDNIKWNLTQGFYSSPSHLGHIPKQSQNDSVTIELFFQLFLMVASIAFVVLFCELGEMLSKAYDQIDQQLFNCNWYKFPNEIRRMLLVVIANVQQPVTICGYGNILCGRDTLKRVRSFTLNWKRCSVDKLNDNHLFIYLFISFWCRQPKMDFHILCCFVMSMSTAICRYQRIIANFEFKCMCCSSGQLLARANHEATLFANFHEHCIDIAELFTISKLIWRVEAAPSKASTV